MHVAARLPEGLLLKGFGKGAPTVNSAVNSSVVSAMARIATRFRFRLNTGFSGQDLRWLCRFLPGSFAFTACQFSILNAKNAVGRLRGFLVMGDHDNGLPIFLACDLQ